MTVYSSATLRARRRRELSGMIAVITVLVLAAMIVAAVWFTLPLFVPVFLAVVACCTIAGVIVYQQ